MSPRQFVGRPMGRGWSNGPVLLGRVEPSGATTAEINNCFSSLYKFYVVKFSLTNSANALQQIRLGVAGTPDANANYSWGTIYYTLSSAATGSGGNGAAATSAQISGNGGTQRTEGTIHLYNPQAAVKTTGTTDLMTSNGATLTDAIHINGGLFFDGATQFTDIQFLQNTGTITGWITVSGVPYV